MADSTWVMIFKSNIWCLKKKKKFLESGVESDSEDSVNDDSVWIISGK